MESKNELKEIDIKNRTYYYFDDTMRIDNIYFNNVLLHEKSCENVLIYDISSQTFMGEKPLCIRFDKIAEFIKIFNGIRYLGCDVCHYWYFLNKGFKFQPNICNRYHDLLMMSMNLSEVDILSSKSADCCCVISVLEKMRP